MSRLTLALILSLTLGCAQAQPDGRGQGPKGPPPVPTAVELQQRLGLDAAKAAQVHALMTTHAQARRQMNESHRDALKAVLTPEQFDRLKPRGPGRRGEGQARPAQR